MDRRATPTTAVGSAPRHVRITSQVRRLEAAIGADRPGGMSWLWLVPVASFTVTAVLFSVFGWIEGLALYLCVPLAIFSGAFMFLMSAFQLTSFSADPDERLTAPVFEEEPEAMRRAS